MMRSASFVSSADAPITSAGVRTSSSPSTDPSQRRTLETSSACVSPSNDNVGMTGTVAAPELIPSPAYATDGQDGQPKRRRHVPECGSLGAGHGRQHAAEPPLVAVEVAG